VGKDSFYLVVWLVRIPRGERYQVPTDHNVYQAKNSRGKQIQALKEEHQKLQEESTEARALVESIKAEISEEEKIKSELEEKLTSLKLETNAVRLEVGTEEMPDEKQEKSLLPMFRL